MTLDRVAPGLRALEAGATWRNWGRSVSVRPEFVARPRSLEEVVDVVREAARRGLRVKAIGAGHSFTGIAVATGIQLDLRHLNGLVSVDADSGRARIAAGTVLHEASALLSRHGLALENLGDIDTQTISGAISTGTHGTGSRVGGLASRVTGMTIVTADAAVLTISETENAELLPAAAVSLGALGVIVDVTVQCVAAFLLHAVERPEPLDAVLDAFEERANAVDHFEFYWFPHTDVALTKTHTRLPIEAPRHPLGRTRRFVDDRLMANGLFALSCAVSRALPAITPAVNRMSTGLTGHREFTDTSPLVFATPRDVRFRECEYAIPVPAIPQAVRDIRQLIDTHAWTISFPIEVRVAAADDVWLSTAYGRVTGYIAVHRYHREDPLPYFRAVERVLRRHGGRPHWGKLHLQDAGSLARAYPRHADFVALRDRLDPDRMFTNDYLERVLGR